MCLVLVACESIPGYPLVLAANRDEFHERPAQALAWWSDWPQLAGGRDLRAGGTWLAVRSDGWFAVVLNAVGEAPSASAPSRGALVPRLLAASDPRVALERVEAECGRYAGFHLVAGRLDAMWYLSNTHGGVRSIGSGVHVIGNTGLDRDDPRARHARGAFPRATAEAPEALMDLLGDERNPGEGDGDSRPIFIRDPRFGTRCSTALWLAGTGRAALHERRFDASGERAGDSHLAWHCRSSSPGWP